MKGTNLDEERRPRLVQRLLDDVRRGKVPGHHRLRQGWWLLRARARMLVDRGSEPQGRDIHAFVIWSRALGRSAEILEDLERRFLIRDVVRVDWGRADFSTSMTRFYGGVLPPDAEKEEHCGTDPFTVVVVEDPRPVYGARPSPKGYVNTAVFDAKRRYRAWTGGGHRIHASVEPSEADHDLFLLLGRRRADYLEDGDAWTGAARDRGSLLGANGWRDVDELLTALEVATPYVQLDADSSLASPCLTLLVENRVRAALTANTRPDTAGLDSEAHRVTIGGREWQLNLRRLGDGSLALARQRALLRQRVRDHAGRFVPAPTARP